MTASPVTINVWLPPISQDPSTDSHGDGPEGGWERTGAPGRQLLLLDVCALLMSLPAAGPGETPLHTPDFLGSEWNQLLRLLWPGARPINLPSLLGAGEEEGPGMWI